MSEALSISRWVFFIKLTAVMKYLTVFFKLSWVAVGLYQKSLRFTFSGVVTGVVNNNV